MGLVISVLVVLLVVFVTINAVAIVITIFTEHQAGKRYRKLRLKEEDIGEE